MTTNRQHVQVAVDNIYLLMDPIKIVQATKMWGLKKCFLLMKTNYLLTTLELASNTNSHIETEASMCTTKI